MFGSRRHRVRKARERRFGPVDIAPDAFVAYSTARSLKSDNDNAPILTLRLYDGEDTEQTFRAVDGAVPVTPCDEFSFEFGAAVSGIVDQSANGFDLMPYGAEDLPPYTGDNLGTIISGSGGFLATAAEINLDTSEGLSLVLVCTPNPNGGSFFSTADVTVGVGFDIGTNHTSASDFYVTFTDEEAHVTEWVSTVEWPEGLNIFVVKIAADGTVTVKSGEIDLVMELSSGIAQPMEPLENVRFVVPNGGHLSKFIETVAWPSSAHNVDSAMQNIATFYGLVL